MNNINKNWEAFAKRPTWSTVTTRELADIFGTNIININNWLCRGQFPEPEPRKRGYGNKNRFRISKVRSWLEKRSETEIHDEWITTHINGVQHMRTFEEIQEFVFKSWRILGLEKPT